MNRSLFAAGLLMLLVGCKSGETKTEAFDEPQSIIEPQGNTMNEPKTVYELALEGVTPKFEIAVTGNWNLSIDTIPEAEALFKQDFYVEESTLDDKSRDLILLEKAKEFPDLISLSDSCVKFAGIDFTVEMCRNQSGDSRGWTGYRLEEIKGELIIMSEWAYEVGVSYLIDTKSRKIHYFSSSPNFVNDSIVFSQGMPVDDDYKFQIVDIKNQKGYSFNVKTSWMISGFNQKGNVFYFEFHSYGKNSKKKFLRIKI